jgi:hypothetical protein
MEDFLLCVIDSKIQVKEYTSIVIKLQGDVKSINLELNPIQEIIIPT